MHVAYSFLFLGVSVGEELSLLDVVDVEVYGFVSLSSSS